MKEKRVILVIGATGAQGGSVAGNLLKDDKYYIRCLTRNPDSEKAIALRNAGAEVVKGDLDNIDSLHAALEGCYGVFGVTNFWEHFNGEFQQGKNLIDAVADAKVSHFVLSTLPYASKISNGKLDVPHFDLKAQLEEYARSLDINSTFIHVAFYYENFIYFFPPQRYENGNFAFGFPQGDAPLAGVSVEDLGRIVVSIFDQPEVYKNRVVGIVGDDLKPEEYAGIMSRILGKTIVYNYIPRDVFASFDFPGADDLANMFEFNRLYIPNRQKDLEESRLLNPGIQNFETWLTDHKDLFHDLLKS